MPEHDETDARPCDICGEPSTQILTPSLLSVCQEHETATPADYYAAHPPTSTTPNLRIPKAQRWRVEDKKVDEAETK